MPFTVFSPRADANAALELLRAVEPEGDYEANPEEQGWSMTFSQKEGLFKKKKIKVNYSQAWCSPPNWPTQLEGMKNYASQFGLPEAQMLRLAQTISELKSTYGLECEPEIEETDDWRLGLIHLLAANLDGIIFTPGAFLDAEFQPLGDADGEFDPDAVFPASSGEAVAAFEADAPDDERVLRRLFALALVAGRGVLEMDATNDDIDDPAGAHKQLLQWMEHLNVVAELEGHERHLVQTPPGELSQQDTVDSVWRLEGLTVIAWSLGLMALPPYDQCVHTPDILNAVHFLEANAMETVRANTRLRLVEERNVFAEQMFAFNWRMTNQRVSPGPVDFAKMQEECWFGPLDLSWARFDGNDLEIGGCGVGEASPEFVSLAVSIAAERHRAANWLRGDALLYSDAETNT